MKPKEKVIHFQVVGQYSRWDKMYRMYILTDNGRLLSREMVNSYSESEWKEFTLPDFDK